MSKFKRVQDAVYSRLDSAAWKDVAVATYPRDFFIKAVPREYVRVSILSNGPSLNLHSVSGMLMLEIFTDRDAGPTRAVEIADSLTLIFSKKTVSDGNFVTQFMDSSLTPNGPDKDTNRLTKQTLSVPFNHFGVL